MKKENDFSKGVRGKFANSDGEFNLPRYLEPEIADPEWEEECIAEALHRSAEMDADPSKGLTEEEFWPLIEQYLAEIRIRKDEEVK